MMGRNLSEYVEAFLKTFQECPERFDIEYCYKHNGHTHIQLRDVEMGYEKGAWLYIRDKGYWYTSCQIGGVTVADNLANVLTEYEIETIYKTISKYKTFLSGEKKKEGLIQALGRYLKSDTKG